MDWTAMIWRVLCLLATITVCAGVTGLLWTLSPVVQAVGLVALGVVCVCVCVASHADSRSVSRRSSCG